MKILGTLLAAGFLACDDDDLQTNQSQSLAIADGGGGDAPAYPCDDPNLTPDQRLALARAYIDALCPIGKIWEQTPCGFGGPGKPPTSIQLKVGASGGGECGATSCKSDGSAVVTVYVCGGGDCDAMLCTSVVHELVHACQCAEGTDSGPCQHQADEVEAYFAGWAWCDYAQPASENCTGAWQALCQNCTAYCNQTDTNGKACPADNAVKQRCEEAGCWNPAHPSYACKRFYP